jgi:drug/metabolite transporter superfamily protein YnfA
MIAARALALFGLTALAEIVGCYLPCLSTLVGAVRCETSSPSLSNSP